MWRLGSSHCRKRREQPACARGQSDLKPRTIKHCDGLAIFECNVKSRLRGFKIVHKADELLADRESLSSRAALYARAWPEVARGPRPAARYQQATSPRSHARSAAIHFSKREYSPRTTPRTRVVILDRRCVSEYPAHETLAR